MSLWQMRKQRLLIGVVVLVVALAAALFFRLSLTRQQGLATTGVSAPILPQKNNTVQGNAPSKLVPKRGTVASIAPAPPNPSTPGPKDSVPAPKDSIQAVRTMQLGSLPSLDKPLAPQLPELEDRARNGDSDAALALWYGLEQCKNVASESNSQYLQASTNFPKGIPDPAPGISKLLDNCNDVPGDQILNNYGWLKMAALQGNPQAQYMYALAGADAIGGEQYALEHPGEWKDYEDAATSYLNNLAETCNPTVLTNISYTLKNGDQLYDVDMTKSYMYQLVALKNDPALPESVRQQVLNPFTAKMTSDQVSSASAMADQFYSQYCN